MVTGRRRKVERSAGIDRATEAHAVCVVEADGGIRARFDVPGTGEPFDGLVERPVGLGAEDAAIERPDGPLVEAMLQAGLRVSVIAPRMPKAPRQRCSATGARSGPGDASVLADVVRTDGHRPKPPVADAAGTKVLRALTRTREDLVGARVALVNQPRAQLELCSPGAVGLSHGLDPPVSIASLRRHPTAHRARSLGEARLAAFLRHQAHPGDGGAHLGAHLLGLLGGIWSPLLRAAARRMSLSVVSSPILRSASRRRRSSGGGALRQPLGARGDELIPPGGQAVGLHPELAGDLVQVLAPEQTHHRIGLAPGRPADLPGPFPLPLRLPQRTSRFPWPHTPILLPGV
jgi:hypothetical protein